MATCSSRPTAAADVYQIRTLSASGHASQIPNNKYSHGAHSFNVTPTSAIRHRFRHAGLGRDLDGTNQTQTFTWQSTLPGCSQANRERTTLGTRSTTSATPSGDSAVNELAAKQLSLSARRRKPCGLVNRQAILSRSLERHVRMAATTCQSLGEPVAHQIFTAGSAIDVPSSPRMRLQSWAADFVLKATTGGVLAQLPNDHFARSGDATGPVRISPV